MPASATFSRQSIQSQAPGLDEFPRHDACGSLTEEEPRAQSPTSKFGASRSREREVSMRWAIIAVVGAVVLGTAMPAAANSKPATGPRINFFAPPDSFAANTPFHIEQGFGCLLDDRTCVTSEITGTAGFQLYVDG